jgi:hypothetical protein
MRKLTPSIVLLTFLCVGVARGEELVDAATGLKLTTPDSWKKQTVQSDPNSPARQLAAYLVGDNAAFSDNINFIIQSLPQAIPAEMMPQVLEQVAQTLKGQFNAEVEAAKTSDIPAAGSHVMDYTMSVNGQDIHGRQYYTLRGDKMVIVTLTCGKDSFAQTSAAVEAVLKTTKFDAPAATQPAR